jgi:hypothetical protein
MEKQPQQKQWKHTSTTASSSRSASNENATFTGITFNTRTADPRTTHTLSQQPVAPWAYPRTLCSGAPSRASRSQE